MYRVWYKYINDSLISKLPVLSASTLSGSTHEAHCLKEIQGGKLHIISVISCCIFCQIILFPSYFSILPYKSKPASPCTMLLSSIDTAIGYSYSYSTFTSCYDLYSIVSVFIRCLTTILQIWDQAHLHFQGVWCHELVTHHINQIHDQSIVRGSIFLFGNRLEGYGYLRIYCRA